MMFIYIDTAEFIDNVYDDILKYEQMGLFEVIRFNSLINEEKDKYNDMMVGYIEKNGLLSSPDSEEAGFITRFFVMRGKRQSKKRLKILRIFEVY